MCAFLSKVEHWSFVETERPSLRKCGNGRAVPSGRRRQEGLLRADPRQDRGRGEGSISSSSAIKNIVMGVIHEQRDGWTLKRTT